MTGLRRLFLLPGWVLAGGLFVAPLGIVALYSFLRRGAYGGVLWDATMENYGRVFDPLYGAIFLRTALVSIAATTITVALAFPLALFIARSGRRRNLWLQLVLLPFWTSFLVRTYAWMFLLRDTGLINSALLAGGLIRDPLPLLYNDGAVLLGLIYSFLPFAVLPIYTALDRLDPSLLEAAADLGARPATAIARVVLPLSASGIGAAALLVFISCLGAYLTPDLLGGGKTIMAGTLIQNQFTTARDWPFGAALSLILMAAVMVLLLAALRRGRESLL